MAQYPSSAGPQPIDKTRETCVRRSGSSVPTPSSSLPASQAPALESHTVVQSVHVMEALYAFLSPGQEASPLLLLPHGMRGLSNPREASLPLSLYFRRGYGAEESLPTHTHTHSLSLCFFSLSLSLSLSLTRKSLRTLLTPSSEEETRDHGSGLCNLEDDWLANFATPNQPRYTFFA